MGKRWLVKTEPGDYGLEDLLADGRTLWDGVRNALARRHLEAMRRGDAVLVYHSGKEKAVVGTARVGNTAGPDPELVAGARLARPVTLAEIKADRRLAGWELVRMPRLSVMPVSEPAWKAVMERAKGGKKKPRERA